MTKAKKWKIAIIVLLGLVATVLIAIGEGRFWKYQENYIPDGTYQMIKYEAKSAYSNELINWTERGENNDSLYEDFIVVENMKSQFYYVTLSPFRSQGAKQINHPLCGCASKVIPS